MGLGKNSYVSVFFPSHSNENGSEFSTPNRVFEGWSGHLKMTSHFGQCPLPHDHLRKWVHKADVDTKKHSQAGWSDEDEVVLRGLEPMAGTQEQGSQEFEQCPTQYGWRLPLGSDDVRMYFNLDFWNREDSVTEKIHPAAPVLAQQWIYGFVWKCCVPLNPMVLLIIIPFLNGYFIGNINPTFSDKPILAARSVVIKWCALLTAAVPRPCGNPCVLAPSVDGLMDGWYRECTKSWHRDFPKWGFSPKSSVLPSGELT